MKRLSSIAIVIVMLLVGCSLLQRQQPMTKEAKLITIYRIYNAQYEDYISMIEKESMTTTHDAVNLEMLKEKRKALEVLGVLIPLYDSQVSAGIDNPDLEKRIYDQLNALK